MIRRAILTLMLVALHAPPSSAATDVYTGQNLAADGKRYTEKFKFLFHQGLWNFMTPAERQALQGAVIRHPERGSTPITFKAVVVEGTPMVRAPVTSLKFIEDLSVAYAWRYENKFSLEPMDEYLYMLKHRPAADFPGGRYPDPMTALGVPPRIWESDKQVDELSLRFRNTAWAFILAHELGHLRFRHTESPASPAEIQQQEEAADQFAVDLLNRSDTIPMGVILWFQATAAFMQNRSDFADDAAYADWLRTEATHPVNGRRLRNLAGAMQRQAAAARDANSADVLEFIAVRLDAIGETVEDPAMQRLVKRCALSRRPEDLRRREDRPCF